ncbi:unnamed protein product [Alopecurus aequalis]
MSSLRRCSRSPVAAPPLEDDDLLAEILLRLPPLPSSLPRASAKSERNWRKRETEKKKSYFLLLIVALGLHPISPPQQFQSNPIPDEQPPPLLPIAGGGATAGGRRPARRDPPPPPATALLSPPRLRRLQALARPRLRPLLLRRFIAHHHRNPPLLGCFVKRFGNIFFQPALEAPNRVPQGRFTFPLDAGNHFTPLGCRHGLVLSFHGPRKQLLVWDPVIGDQHRLEVPPGFDTETNRISAAVRRTVGDAQHFEVVLVGTSDLQHTKAVASVYSSATSLWGNIITTMVPSKIPMSYLPTLDFTTQPAMMAGDFLYWKLVGDFVGILEFDLEKQCLAITQVPWKVTSDSRSRHSWNILTEGGGLCLLLLPRFIFHAQLWKRKTYCDGVSSWVLERTIDLEKLLSLYSEKEREPPVILGVAEENNVVLVWTLIGVFLVQLESLQFKKIYKCNRSYCYYPFEGVYTTDTGIGGGNGGAELLHNTSDDLSR